MPGIDRLASNVIGPLPPGWQRGRDLAGNACRPPESQHGARYLPPGGVIRLVRLKVDALPSPVVLTGRMNARGVLKERAIMRERPRIEGRKVFGFTRARQASLKAGDGCMADERFRQWVGLREEGPMPDPHRKRAVHRMPHRVGGNDVQDREALEPTGMVERKAVGHTTAPVVPGEPEADKAKLLHDFD